MVKSQVCKSEKTFLTKGKWSPQEDQKLIAYIRRYRIWNWSEMAKAAGLFRSGKSCRLRWMNYLRPGIKHGNFSQEEDQIIIKLREELGPRWSIIAARLPGRTDNEIKNYWNGRLRKRLQNNLVPTSSQETQTATIDANLQGSPISEVDFFFPNAPKSSNSHGSKATPPSPTQSSSNEFSSSSSNPSGEFYVNQTIVEKFGLSDQYGKLQSLLEQPFQMEGVGMMEVYGDSADPEFLVPTFHGDFTDEESQISWELRFSMEGSNMVQGYGATKDAGFLVNFHGGLADEEVQSSLEQPFPVEGLDMVQDFAATTVSGFQLPTFHGCFADEELHSSLKQPFPMEGLNKVDVYGSTNPEFMVSTSTRKITDEELRRLLEEPFQMEGLDMVECFGTGDPGFTASNSHRAFSDEQFITLCGAEGYEATTYPGFEIPTWQRGPQEGHISMCFLLFVEIISVCNFLWILTIFLFILYVFIFLNRL